MRFNFSSHRSVRRQRGLSLVELLVAMALGIVMLAGTLLLYSAMSGATRTSSQESQLNEDGTLALQILKQQLQLAGDTGLAAGTDGAPNFAGVSVLGCNNGFASNTANYMGTTGATLATIACSTTSGPDAISVRYQADLQNTSKVTVSNVDAPSNCAREALFAGTGNTFSTAENRFYIAQDSANGNAKSLYCVGVKKANDNTAAEFGTAVALIPHVEDLQMEYVVAATSTSAQATSVVNADNTHLGATLDNWRRVLGVQVCLVMRSAEPVPLQGVGAATIGAYKNCNGTDVTDASDRYLRRAFRTTIAFRNTRTAIPNAFIANGDPWAVTN
jgi:type IV pilus assembly protein PilW